jgi:hypothetical protein
MSNQNHVPRAVFKSFFSIADQLPPLKSRKNPAVAATLGFALGGIGLFLYLQSIMDFFIPLVMLVILFIVGIPTGEALLLLAPVVWAIYGYRRVKASNAKLDDDGSYVDIRDHSVITLPPPLPPVPQLPLSAAPRSFEARLRKVDDLLRDGYVTPTEHATQRAEILKEL